VAVDMNIPVDGEKSILEQKKLALKQKLASKLAAKPPKQEKMPKIDKMLPEQQKIDKPKNQTKKTDKSDTDHLMPPEQPKIETEILDVIPALPRVPSRTIADIVDPRSDCVIPEIFKKLDHDDALKHLEGLALAGLNDQQLAEYLGINKDAFENWQKRYEIIASTIKNARTGWLSKVAGSIYHRAAGYEYTEKQILPNGQEKIFHRHQPADVASAIFILKNRLPELWQDSKRVEVSGDTSIVDRMSRMKEDTTIIDVIINDDKDSKK
jgi:hypothetical protein